MKNPLFYLKTGSTLLLSLTSAWIIATGIAYSGLWAGLLAFSALLLLRSARKNSLKEGRTDRMKVVLVTSTVLYELLLLLGAASVETGFASVIAISAVAFTEILRLESVKRLKTSFTPDIGREGRITVLAVSMVAYSFNSYFMFYGLAFIALIAIYDSLRLLHFLNNNI